MAMAGAPGSKQEALMKYVPGYTLPTVDHGIQRVLLQVFGMLGHGKSSLVNLCICVMKNEAYRNLAVSGSDFGGMTIRRQEYELTSKLFIIDNRGFRKITPNEILESSAQFRCLRSMGEVTWTGKNLSEALAHFNKQRRTRPVDFMVPVFVYSCSRPWNNDDGKEMEKAITNAHSITGVNPIIVITNSSSGGSGQITSKFRDIGSTRIITLENYTNENQTRTPEADGRILEFLTICMEEAEPGIGRMVGQDPTERLMDQMIKHVQQETELLKKKKEELRRKI